MQRSGESPRVPAGVDEFDLPAIPFVKASRHEGRLIDNDGKPVADAWVYGIIDRQPVGGVTTDRDGKFNILLPGDYESFIALVNGAHHEAALEKTDPLLLKLP